MLILTLLKGIAVGIVIALPVGPVGLLVVRRTLFEGPRFGLVSSLGAAIADATFAAIAGFGLTFISDWLIRYEDWFGIGGGILLLFVGAKALTLRSPAQPEPLSDEAILGAFASTFFLTLANPITILSFAAVFTKLGGAEITDLPSVAILVLGAFLGSVVIWLSVVFGITGLKRFAGRFELVWLNRISGSILSLSGAGLIVAAIIGFVAH
jgi:threonine/homoserine/homoserine lactone efflux protein